jgi:hypothetical protein
MSITIYGKIVDARVTTYIYNFPNRLLEHFATPTKNQQVAWAFCNSNQESNLHKTLRQQVACALCNFHLRISQPPTQNQILDFRTERVRLRFHKR